MLTMWRHFQPGSSPVDWCEGNYMISPVIAEFVNTFSNVLFFLLPPVLMHLFREYGRFVNRGIHVIWLMLMVVGISSAYFHATLSLIGQLLDEISILWVYMTAFSMFYPRKFFPYIFHDSRKLFTIATLLVSVVATGLSILHPVVNAFALMTLSIPAFVVLLVQLKHVKCCRIYRLGVRCSIMWLISITCWINDRFFCEIWSHLNFPYLHGLWHVFIFIASYTACVLFAYFAVKEECPEQTPVLKYWPQDNFELGIPYISLRCRSKADSNQI